MTFLNQILLFGGAAAVIPIIIHLLNRRRFKRVPWAAMRFVQVSLQRNQRRMQLEDLILLMIRCLLLALLAFALARPAVSWVRGNFFGSSSVATAIVLDRSGSMAAGARFESAKGAALETIDALPAGSAAAVLLTSDAADGGIFEPTSDLRLARKVVEEAGLSDRGTDLLPSVEKALEMLARGSAIERELVVITDGQEQGWAEFEPLLNQLAEAKDTRVHVVLVGPQQAPENLGISDLRQTSALTPVGQALRFEIAVTNYGSNEAESVPVSLAIDGEPAGEPFVIEKLPAGETRRVTLFAKLSSPGYHRATATLPADSMPGDDRRTIVLRAADGVGVLLVDGQPGREELDSEVFFLRNALVPVPPEMAGDFFIKTSTVGVADFAPAALEGQRVVVLANVAELPGDTTAALGEFVEAGGGLIVFTGDNTGAANTNAALGELLPAALGEILPGPLTLQASGYDHAVTALWDDPGSGSLASAEFGRAFALTLAEDARAVLRFNDGSPAIAGRDHGRGRVFLFASTADTAWNNLPVRPAFLPLMHRLVGAVVARGESGLNIAAGTPFNFDFPVELAGREAVVTDSDGQSSTREIGAAAEISYAKTDRAGAYEVSVADPPTLLQFASQPAAAESRLDPLSAGQRERIAQHAELVQMGPSTELREVLGRGRNGAELWAIILAAVIILAIVEMALAQWFSREK